MFPGPESTSVPAFVAKLWQMVNDPNYDDLIAWCENGTSFVIKDQLRFCSELLPMYYKHNNMASFIRQLNKYGFRKVVSVNSASLKGDVSDFEFCHPHFIKDCPLLLEQIKRKVSISRDISDYKNDQGLLTKLLLEVQQLHHKQSAFESRISSMKAENDALWREHSILRQKHQKQQKIVNRLIHFLLSLVHQTRQGVNVKRRSMPLMLKDGSCLPIEGMAPLKPERSCTSPVICEINPTDIILGTNSQQTEVSVPYEVIIPDPLEENNGVKPALQNSKNILLEVSPPLKLTNPVQEVVPTIVLEPTVVQTKADNAPNKAISNNEGVTKLPEKRSLVSVNDKRMKVRKIAPNIQNVDPLQISASSSSINSSFLNPNLKGTDKKSNISMILNGKPSNKSQSHVAKKKLIKKKHMKSVPVNNIEIVNNDPPAEILLKEEPSVEVTTIDTTDPVANIFSNDIDYTTDDQSALLSSDPIIFSPSGSQMLSPELVDLPVVNEENLNNSLVLSDSSSSSISKQDAENHIDLIQSDLDALKEMLHGEGLSLDASTIMGLFGSEDPLFLNMPEAGRSTDNLISSPVGNELVTYNTPTLIDITDGLDEDDLAVNDPLLDDIPSTLNTPQATTLTLDFPSPTSSKRLKK